MQPDRDITALLPRLLADIKRPGDFYGTGEVPLPVVRLAVDGVGILGLPLPPMQVEALARVATPAPYGRGRDTLVDPTVRRCGQIGASAVDASDWRWQALLDTVVGGAVAALGVEGGATASLYKMLVYERGDFFREHRDTEKVPGMFATLVIVLPAEHEGGELVIRHEGREVTVDLSGPDLGLARWAAFYTDCQHELMPLRSGHRVALIYNLGRREGPAPRVPDHRPQIARVAEALREWAAGPDTPVKVVYPLAHRYTPAELSFAALKNEDAAVAAVLEHAATRSDCVLRLAMVSIEESGSAEPIWTGRRGGWGHAEPERYEVIDVSERTQTLDGWRHPDDRPEAMGPVRYEDSEVSPAGALADEEPDDEHFREATGNEGASFDRTYHRAALVLWPEARELEVIQQGGPEAAIAALERFLADPADVPRAEAMAHLIVNAWPRPSPESYWTPYHHDRARLIAALARVEDTGALSRFLREVIGAGAFDGSETEAIVAALARVRESDASEIIAAVAHRRATARWAPVTRLLRAAARARPGASLSTAAQVVLAAMRTVDEVPSGDRERTNRAEGLADLVHAIGGIGVPDLGAELARAALANPARWPFDGVVVPAVLALPRSGSAAYRAAADPLRGACLLHLRARIALPLAPPADAVRSRDRLTCTCRDCSALGSFLADPVATTWTLKAVAAQRAHIEEWIKRAGCDVDFRTERRGSPHTLVCAKNQASYQALVRQRAADLEHLAQIERS